MRIQQYSKNYYKTKNRNRFFVFLVCLCFCLNILEAYWIIFVLNWQWAVGNFLLQIMFLMTILAVIVKISLYDKAVGSDERYMKIYWLCNIGFGEKPIKKNSKNTGSRSTNKLPSFNITRTTVGKILSNVSSIKDNQ